MRVANFTVSTAWGAITTPRFAAAALRVPGDWLLHPAPLGAVFILAFNDRVLKAAYGTWWTGKLSDVAGLVFFPWFLLSLGEVIRWAVRLRWQSGRQALTTSVVATLVVFSIINSSVGAGQLYEALLRQIWALLRSATGLYVGPVRHTVDPTDLLTLPALWVPWKLGIRRLTAPSKAVADRQNEL